MHLRVVGVLFFIVFTFMSELASAQSARIRVGYSGNYGIISAQRSGIFTGYGYEYLQEVARYTGWEYAFVEGSWESNLQRLKNGEIDLLGPMQMSSERMEIFDFPAFHVGYEQGVMHVRGDNHQVYYDDFDRFEGMRVGLVRSNYHNKAFEKYRISNGFTIIPVYVDDTLDLVRMLQSGEVDAMVSGSMMDAPNTRLVARFSVEPFYFATKKGNKRVLNGMNVAIETIRTHRLYFDAELHSKYLQSESVERPVVTRSEQAYVNMLPRLKMAYQSNWLPVQYRDSHGYFRGISAELMRKMAEYGGLAIDYVPVATYAEGMQALERGDVDLMAGMVLGYEDVNAMQISGMKFSIPYMKVPLVLVGSRKVPASEDLRIVVPTRLVSLQQHVLEIYPKAVFMPMENFSDGLEAVRSGRAQAMFMSIYLYDRLMGTEQLEGLQLVSVSNMMIALSVGISPQHGALMQSVIEKALARVTESDLQKAVFANVERDYAPLTLGAVLRKYAFYLWWIIACLVGGAVLFYLRLQNKASKLLWREAYIDPLTGFENWRRLSMNMLTQPLCPPYACAVLDVDDFKLINDYFGYSEGSRVLRHMAQCMQEALGKNELFARRNGDIFVMVLHYEGEAPLRQRLGRIFDLMADLPHSSEQDLEHRPIHIACGVYVVGAADASLSLNSIYDRANTARKSLKPLHGNGVAFFDAEMLQQQQEVQEIELRMDDALLREEFEVYFQPKVDVADGSVVGAEALVRWNHTQRGQMSPQAFVPIFEANGFIQRLDMYVLMHVCRRLREWLDKGFRPVPVSVNISKTHISRASFVPNVQSILDMYAIPPQLVELEFTESAFLDDENAMLRVMEQLRGLGFTLSLDDFGTGYSSLNMLKDMPVQVLKLDRGFFDVTACSSRGRQVLASIVQMAKTLNLHVLSEGVESAEQAMLLREIGCDYAQGFFYARPMPMDAFEKILFTLGGDVVLPLKGVFDDGEPSLA